MAQRQLANVEWQVECRRAELTQLELVAHPPVQGRGPLYEVVKRPLPPGLDVCSDTIVFPAGKPPAGNVGQPRSMPRARLTAARRQRLLLGSAGGPIF